MFSSSEMAQLLLELLMSVAYGRPIVSKGSQNRERSQNTEMPQKLNKVLNVR